MSIERRKGHLNPFRTLFEDNAIQVVSKRQLKYLVDEGMILLVQYGLKYSYLVGPTPILPGSNQPHAVRSRAENSDAA